MADVQDSAEDRVVLAGRFRSNHPTAGQWLQHAPAEVGQLAPAGLGMAAFGERHPVRRRRYPV